MASASDQACCSVSVEAEALSNVDEFGETEGLPVTNAVSLADGSYVRVMVHFLYDFLMKQTRRSKRTRMMMRSGERGRVQDCEPRRVQDCENPRLYDRET